MNLPSFEFLQLVPAHSTTVSSPKLDLVTLAWDHIAARYLNRLKSDRILAGRVRSIRQLAVHDAIHSVIDPGNGYLFKEISIHSTTDAAAAAAIRASHDILASVFRDPRDRADLADHLEESLSLLYPAPRYRSGVETGAGSASTYLKIFGALLHPTPAPERVSAHLRSRLQPQLLHR